MPERDFLPVSVTISIMWPKTDLWGIGHLARVAKAEGRAKVRALEGVERVEKALGREKALEREKALARAKALGKARGSAKANLDPTIILVRNVS